MRRILRNAGIVTASLVFALGVASATDRDAPSAEGRAYLGFTFGGERAAPRDLHYGLRLDHDARFREGETAPLLQLDFTRRGMNDARVNGMSVVSPRYKLRQAEEEEVVEDEGFFEGMWNGVKNFFGGLFGGDDDEAAEAAAETADEAPEELAEGTFMGYNVVDWSLLAVSAVGIGFITSEIVNGNEDPDSAASGGATTGGATTGGGTPIGGTTPVGLTPLGFISVKPELSRETRERLEWLDGGTGHMGDLEPQER